MFCSAAPGLRVDSSSHKKGGSMTFGFILPQLMSVVIVFVIGLDEQGRSAPYGGTVGRYSMVLGSRLLARDSFAGLARCASCLNFSVQLPKQ